MAHNSASGLGAILLAAGGSSRLGEPKQLIEIEGEPLVVRQAKLLLGLKPARVVVVTGAESEHVGRHVASLDVLQVHNPDWQQGMGVSLACGIHAMPERARAALVLLCDQWKVKAGDLESLVRAWAQDPHQAVIADYGESTGPPAILPRAMFERLGRLQGDSGAKKVLRHWKGEVCKIAMPSATPDIDQPGDLEH